MEDIQQEEEQKVSGESCMYSNTQVQFEVLVCYLSISFICTIILLLIPEGNTVDHIFN